MRLMLDDAGFDLTATGIRIKVGPGWLAWLLATVMGMAAILSSGEALMRTWPCSVDVKADGSVPMAGHDFDFAEPVKATGQAENLIEDQRQPLIVRRFRAGDAEWLDIEHDGTHTTFQLDAIGDSQAVGR